MDPDSKFYISQDDFDTVIAYAQSAYDQFKSEIGGQMIILAISSFASIYIDAEVSGQYVSVAYFK